MDALKLMKDPLTALSRAAARPHRGQAAGGVGSILTLAQEKLIKGDFDKTAQPAPGEQVHGAGQESGRGDRADQGHERLARPHLRCCPEAQAKFVPAVMDYIGRAGGESRARLLAGARK